MGEGLLARAESVNFFNVTTVDIKAELAELDGSWRPLRPAVRGTGPPP
jgi:hypothetical protein